MKVITIAHADLDAMTRRIAEQVTHDLAGQIDWVVGIQRGGHFVAQSFLKNFSNENYHEYADVKVQRPSTKHKTPRLSRLLKLLPYSVLDFLRKIESCILANKKQECLQLNLNLKGRSFLVIDDAVDSGVTMRSVVDSLRRGNPGAEIHTACITITTAHPAIVPDYYVFNNKTLVRFPWASDYKG